MDMASLVSRYILVLRVGWRCEKGGGESSERILSTHFTRELHHLCLSIVLQGLQLMFLRGQLTLSTQLQSTNTDAD